MDGAYSSRDQQGSLSGSKGTIMLCDTCQTRLSDQLANAEKLSLKDLRLGFGRTQEELADILGVHQVTISRAEAGKKLRGVNLLKYAQLLAALGQL